MQFIVYSTIVLLSYTVSYRNVNTSIEYYFWRNCSDVFLLDDSTTPFETSFAFSQPTSQISPQRTHDGLNISVLQLAASLTLKSDTNLTFSLTNVCKSHKRISLVIIVGLTL